MKKLWHNGLFYTMESEGKTVDSIITEGEHILKTGKYEALLSYLEGEQFEKINCNGQIGFPGFIDSHLHLIGHGEAMNRVDLSKCQSYDEMLERIKSVIEEETQMSGSSEKDGMKTNGNQMQYSALMI